MFDLEKQYRNTSVLVTGGAGFIGSNLVEKLLELGADVTVFDNFSTGNMMHIAHFLPHITLIKDDLANLEDHRQMLLQQKYVFHLAAISNIPLANKNPQLCTYINTQCTNNLGEILSQSTVLKKLVFSSTSAVYGNATSASSEQDAVAPVSVYAQSKLDAEQALHNLSLHEELPVTCLRYYNVFGKNMQPGAALAQFANRLQSNQPIVLFGDGMQTRDFVPVEEVVQANLFAAASNSANFEIFNIASGRSQTMLEVIEELAAKLGVQKYQLDFQPGRQGDAQQSRANIEKWQNFAQHQMKKDTNAQF